jgi:hypothetical protein
MFAFVASAMLAFAPLSPQSANPNIEFWYGHKQVFGHLGRPQQQINILGRARADAGLIELTYSLDGGDEVPINWGPDSRRLLTYGDFNIEFFLEHIEPGMHEVTVRAVDKFENEVTKTVQVAIMPEQVWPLPFDTDWSTTLDVTAAAQPVDGHWVRVPGGVRCLKPGYDRLLAVGDMSWTNYEVTVPITIHSVDPAGYLPPSFTPGIGIIMRWNGHTDFFKPGSQPSLGWWPLGAAGEYVYQVDQCGARLQLYGNTFVLQDQDDDCTPIEFDVTHLWKMRVRTLSNGKHEYKLKVWEQGTTEPPAWTLSMIEEASQPSHGSVLLLAHHVDATFGDVLVTSIGSQAQAPETEYVPVEDSRARE